MAANLSYYIAEAVLAGTANGRMINISAGSGGGAGSTRTRPTVHANNPDSTDVKTRGAGANHVHGGPIPAGRYRIRPPGRHPHLGLSARLDPYDAAQVRSMDGRAGFYIHGRGRHGSDGCIVPYESFQDLMAALTRDRGGMLNVYLRMGGDDAEETAE